MISEIAAEHGSTLDLTRRGICGISTNCPKAGGYPDFYAFADIGCYSIANGMNISRIFTENGVVNQTDNHCFNRCGFPQYFALGKE